MNECYFRYASMLPVSTEEAYQWHARPGAVERLLPPWRKIRIIHRDGGLTEGTRLTLEIRIGFIWRRWVSQRGPCIKGSSFIVQQLEGPYELWEQLHRFKPHGTSACISEDEIHYILPGGSLGHWLFGKWVAKGMESLFRYRHAVTANDLSLHRRYSGHKSLNIVIAGASGLIGSALVPFLRAGGHRVLRLVRNPEQVSSQTLLWDPSTGEVDLAALEGTDVVINLAGENISSSRWSAEKKQKIVRSRILATKTLCDAISKLTRPPALLNASAVGYYGNRGDTELTEDSPQAEDFLAQVCGQWEEAASSLRRRGIRVAFLRFGVVLTPASGALAAMITPFKLCLGGPVGGGKQYISWIALDDVLGAILHVIATTTLEGPINIVAPEPITNYAFTKTLGAVLHRPTILPLPTALARLLFGEMAEALLLSSNKVMPNVLMKSNYEFLYPTLPKALNHLFGNR